jgi:hypothetical protein
MVLFLSTFILSKRNQQQLKENKKKHTEKRSIRRERITRTHMSELRPYCTVRFWTQKHLYLSFYSTDFNNFFKNILGLASAYCKNFFFLFCPLSLRNWEAKQVTIVGSWRYLSTKMTSLFLNFDWIKKIFIIVIL